jgi:hypothetical protein
MNVPRSVGERDLRAAELRQHPAQYRSDLRVHLGSVRRHILYLAAAAVSYVPWSASQATEDLWP